MSFFIFIMEMLYQFFVFSIELKKMKERNFSNLYEPSLDGFSVVWLAATLKALVITPLNKKFFRSSFSRNISNGFKRSLTRRDARVLKAETKQTWLFGQAGSGRYQKLKCPSLTKTAIEVFSSGEHHRTVTYHLK